MSGGEDAGGGRTNPYTLANFFESVLGAIYLSCGYEVSKAFVHRELLYKLDNIIKHKLHKNAKTQVQEIVQDHFKITPEYKEISSNGPDHNKVFEMGLYAGSIMLTTGKGNNKQKAEEYAAIEFLKKTDYYLEKIREKL
jgi:ribonuclease-3